MAADVVSDPTVDQNFVASHVTQVAAELVRVVEITMDPSVSQEQRLNAYNACEAFKTESPLCIQCGLYLAQQKQLSMYVQHFGLQLMEYCIKYRWYDLPQSEKLFVKKETDMILSRKRPNRLTV